MFGKLLKYDFRAVARVWWIVAVSALGISLAGATVFRFLFSSADGGEMTGILAAFAVLSLLACAFALAASVLVTMILVYLRFYKNFFTDEGYLTFTLPVSRRELLLSKTVNALIWMALHTLLLTVCTMLFLLIAPPPEETYELLNFTVLDAFGQVFSEIWSMCGAWTLLYAVECVLIAVCAAFYSVSLVHFCITVGSVIAKKQKLLAAIGIYYGVNMVASFLSQMLPYVFVFLMEGFGEIFGVTEGAKYFGAIGLLLMIACLLVATVGSVFYFTTRGMLERKLNLP